MFRLFRVIIRTSNEPTQDYLFPSALWDPVALIVGVVIISEYMYVSIVYMVTYVTMLQCCKSYRYLIGL